MANNRSTSKGQSTTIALDRRLEQVKAAERMVCGAVLLESEAIVRISGILKPGHFYDPAMSAIYKAVYGIWTDGGKPDMLRVCESLLKSGDLEKAGGMYGISQLASKVASTANLEDHALYVRQCYTQRALMQAGGQIRDIAGDLTQDVSDQVSSSIKLVEAVANEMDYDNPAVGMEEATNKALEQYSEKERLRAEGRTYGIMTGLKVLDKYVAGFKPGDLVVLGARPAMGKTSVMLSFAKNMAQSGKRVCIFSLEMSNVSLANRLILSCCPGMDTAAYRGGYLSQGQKEQVLDAVGEIRRLPIVIDETPNISMQQLKVRCLNLKRRQGLDVVMIDYLQLMDMRGDNRQYNREQEISRTTRLLKRLAKDLQVPVVLLSQLNRNIESKAKAKGQLSPDLPGMADLRESGAIEQDADVVLLLHRPEYYKDEDAIKGVGIINIAKQRDGRTGKVEFAYNESLTCIGDVQRAVDKDEVPF